MIEVTVRQTLKKCEILRGHGAYRDVLMRGNVYTGSILKIFTLHVTNKGEYRHQPLVGFSVSRARSAIVRNRIKRLMREIVRRNKEFFYQCCKHADVSHLILMYSSSSNRSVNRSDLSYQELDKEFHMLMKQLSHRQ